MLFDIHAELEEPPTPKADTSHLNVPEVSSDETWIDRLIKSQAYKDQRAKVRRHALEDETVRASLQALVTNGCIMTPAAFATAASVSVARLDGMVAYLQRILNVDGYEIITFSRHENRIELNVSKLKRQFDL
jgi:hypothetical protein